MCKTYQKLPDDQDWFDNIDPLHYRWMYHSWILDQEEEQERLQNIGILIGSFTNPEAANQMQKKKNPDHTMTDEDFEKLINEIESDHQNSLTKKEKKKLSHNMVVKYG